MKMQKRVLPCPLPTLRRRCRTFRSLLVAAAGALMLTAALVPRANATLIVYFNFEDVATPTLNTFDPVADTIAADGFGGIQNSTLGLFSSSGGSYEANRFGSDDALAIAGLNRAAGDTDTTNNQALGLRDTSS